MKYIDAHCHLNDDKLYPEYLEHAQTFFAAGGQGLVVVGCDEASSRCACEVARGVMQQCTHNTDVYSFATVGVHPSEACFGNVTSDTVEQEVAAINSLYMLHHDVVVAIGECGIDMHYEGSVNALPTQKKLFTRQCALAQELGLPLVVHSRDGFEETLDVMRQYPNVVYYLHCFGYGPDEVKKLLEEFPTIYFGFDGNSTYPKANLLREACLVVPDDRILLETDAPYLAPQGLRGTVNVPANIIQIYDFIAQLRGITTETLCEHVEKNVRKLYRL